MNKAGSSDTSATGSQLPSDNRVAPVRVLLADESAVSRQSALALLESEGFKVMVAEDGFEALALMVQHRPDVLLADIMLPRVDGYQLCALVRSNSDHRHTPVILLSPADGLLDQTRASMVRSDAHVCKPLIATRLLSTLRTVVSNARKDTATADGAATENATL